QKVKKERREELGEEGEGGDGKERRVNGLNFIDLMVRQGNIDNPPKTPLVPGFECSGIVEALGDSVKGFEIGDRVMAFVNYNAWAEVVCTPVEFVYKIPEDMSFSEAAAFPMNFVTAYMMLFEVANLREGMSVLIHSAGGGVWWQVEKVNPIKLYEENKVIAGFSLLNLLFKQGRAGLIRGVVDKLIALYNQKKIKPVVDSLWALEEKIFQDRSGFGYL
ncbi:hypothetical protein FD755_005411, partial [Muntiacus reevesi]